MTEAKRAEIVSEEEKILRQLEPLGRLVGIDPQDSSLASTLRGVFSSEQILQLSEIAQHFNERGCISEGDSAVIEHLVDEVLKEVLFSC